jgi:hypothetical protein
MREWRDRLGKIRAIAFWDSWMEISDRNAGIRHEKGDRPFGYFGEKGDRYQFLLSNANSVNFYQ